MGRKTGLTQLLPVALLTLVLAADRSGAAPSDGETAGAAQVGQVTLARPDSGRARFSAQGEELAFERADSRGWTRLWTVRRDGSFERCLTCDNPDFNGHHTGAGVWHPSRELIAFLVERPAQGRYRDQTPPTPFLAVPGRNRGIDVWLVTRDGKRFWNLTNTAARGGNRVHLPVFSHEGDLLAWSERESAAGSEWGSWVAQVGRFRYSRATPRLARVKTHRLPNPGFVAISGFSPDDAGLDLAGPPAQPPLSVAGQDLYRLALPTDSEGDADTGQRVRPWTETPTAWDGHLSFSRDGQRAVFASTQGLPPRPLGRDGDDAFLPVTEMWIADPDGDLLQRLTSFNDPVSDHYLGEPAHVGPAEWTPEGDALLVTVTPRSTARPSLYRLDLQTDP